LTPAASWGIGVLTVSISQKPQRASDQGFFHDVVRLGWGGAKANVRPGIVLWIVGSVIVAGYYLFPPIRDFCNQIGVIKDRYSPGIVIASSALFGSLIPYLFQVIFLHRERRQPFRRVPGLLLFWGIHGWQVDWLYRLQSMIFGDDQKVTTLVQKTLVDQFVWAPLLAVPQVLLAYLFIENDYSLSRTRAALQRKSYLARAIPLTIANWAVWIPAVTLVYLLPLSLQLPLQNLILSLWCLILIFFAKNA
jgi:hypothetical protein